MALGEEKTNAIPWKSAAHAAVVAALQASGHGGDTVRWRDGLATEGRWWASFEVLDAADVVWAAQVDGVAPPNSFAVTTDWGEVGMWRHPNDPTLPGLALAAVPGGLRPLLADAAPGVDPDLVHIVALQPLQRAVVRVGGEGPAVYVKVVPPWRAPVVARHYRTAHAAGLPTPAVLGVEPGLGLIVLEELAGTPLAEHLETGGALPESADLWQVITGLAATLGTHGDLHDRQLLVDDTGSITGVVDLDEAGDGELEDDLGRLLAHATMRGLTHPEQRERIDAWVRALRSRFLGHVDTDALRRREAATLARLHALSRTAGC